MLTKSLALEFGPNIRVNGVSPGSIMWPEIKEYESQHQEIIDSTALKKQGNTSDIANTYTYSININEFNQSVIETENQFEEQIQKDIHKLIDMGFSESIARTAVNNTCLLYTSPSPRDS